MEADSRRRGKTEMRMSKAMKREQMGSAMSQPRYSMAREEMMTPTLPRVSARTWRKTPGREGEGRGGREGGRGGEGGGRWYNCVWISTLKLPALHICVVMLVCVRMAVGVSVRVRVV